MICDFEDKICDFEEISSTGRECKSREPDLLSNAASRLQSQRTAPWALAGPPKSTYGLRLGAQVQGPAGPRNPVT